MSNEKKLREYQGTVKDFVQEHKAFVATLGAGLTLVIGGTVFLITGKKRKSSTKDIAVLLKDSSKAMSKVEKHIDEDIFTSLAPAIEDAIKSKGVENVVLERDYNLGGNLHKFVTVCVENIYGD